MRAYSMDLRQRVLASCQASAERAIGWIADGKMRLAPLLTHAFRPEQASEAYAMMRLHPGDFLGVAFDWR